MTSSVNEPHYVPTVEEAIQIAADVSNGRTRSYVWAAMMLGRFVEWQATSLRAVSSPGHGERTQDPDPTR